MSKIEIVILLPFLILLFAIVWVLSLQGSQENE